MLISRGERAAPRLSFSIGHGGVCRAWAIIEGVICDHSSALTSSGLNNTNPRTGPGSFRTFCQTPIEDPFNFKTTHNANSAMTARYRQLLPSSKNLTLAFSKTDNRNLRLFGQIDNLIALEEQSF